MCGPGTATVGLSSFPWSICAPGLFIVTFVCLGFSRTLNGKVPFLLFLFRSVPGTPPFNGFNRTS